MRIVCWSVLSPPLSLSLTTDDMKHFFEILIIVLFVVSIGALVFLEALQVRALRTIGERERTNVVVDEGSCIDHAEQRANNEVTIMFNYE